MTTARGHSENSFVLLNLTIMLSLSNILKINALSSGATGILLVLFPNFTANIFKVGTTAPFIEVGIFLILFALFVLGTSVKDPINRRSVQVIITLDTLWVISSILAILSLYADISLWGTLIVAGVALWVALMAILQNRALKTDGVSTKGIKGTIAVIALLFVNNFTIAQSGPTPISQANKMIWEPVTTVEGHYA
jgi:hypothetical protein